MKIRIYNFSIIIILGLLFMTGCYATDRYVFSEGLYEYKGEPVNFLDDLYIDELTIELFKITENDFIDSNNSNVLKNSNNLEFYGANISYKYSNESVSIKYHFNFMGKIPGYSDTYKIQITIDNKSIDVKGTLLLRLNFLGFVGDSSYGSKSGRINLKVIEYKINESGDNKIISFPKSLEYTNK